MQARRPGDPSIWLARGLLVLSGCYAIWALGFLPGEFFSVRDNLQRRQEFYEHIAFVPILPAVGALLLLTIQKTAGARADPASWPGWLLARVQLLAAAAVALGQGWLVNRASCPRCEPFEAPTYAFGLVVLLAVAAGVRLAWERRRLTTSPSTNSPAE